MKRTFYSRFIKRPMDLLLSLIAFLILLPIQIILVIMVRIKLGSPVIFKQLRPGLNDKPFYLYKFRSMTNEKDVNGNLLSDDLRLTKFGKFLRSTSLDEFPSLINIIKGDMSIVGPRPLLIEYLNLYDTEQKKRHHVRPGLSGYAQINGRNKLNWEEKFKLDIIYVNNVTFRNDIRIIFKTLIKVLKREGINSSKFTTMDKFTGSRNELETK